MRSAGGRPGLAVGPRKGAGLGRAEMLLELLDADFTSQGRGRLQVTFYAGKPDIGQLAKGQGAIVPAQVRTNYLSNEFLAATFGQLAVSGLERTADLLARTLHQGIVDVR